MPEVAPMGMREQSSVWAVLATAVAVIGIPGGFAALVAMMQIDNADTLGHMSTAQDFVAIAAFAIGLAGISGGSLFLAMRWWPRPGLAITPAGVVVYNWRPLLVPWSMVAGVTTYQRRFGPGPALLLACGDVVALTCAPIVGSWSTSGGARSLRCSVDEVISAGLAECQPERPDEQEPACAPRAASPARHASLRRHQLPGAPSCYRPSRRLSGAWRALPISLPILAAGQLYAAQRGQIFNPAQFVLGIGAVFGTVCLVVGVVWARWARVIAVGPDWLAWKPLWARKWRVLPVSQLASVGRGVDLSRRSVRGQQDQRTRERPGARLSRPQATARRAIALRRSDGRGIQLRPDELDKGVASAILQAAGSHPAMTDEARRELTHSRYRGCRGQPGLKADRHVQEGPGRQLR